MIYNDRSDAGNKLAVELEKYQGDSQAIVVAIPRGGVEIAFYICRKLNLPMEITITKKIGAPFNSELAIGAISEKETIVLNDSLIESLGISDEYIENEKEKQKKEIEKRLSLYRKGKPSFDFRNKKIIIVDDGIATGATIKAVIKFFKKSNVSKITVAVPVASHESIKEIKNICDEIICPLIPNFFNAVGAFYQNFNQVTDKEVIDFIDNLKKENNDKK